MQEQKKTVGRPPSKNKKTKWLKIRVTPETYAMLKDAPKSDLINRGLHILMPTLGVYIKDESRWVEHKEKGTDANLVAYNAICYAIDILRTRREFNGYFSNKEFTLFSTLCLQKSELENHQTFYIQK